MSETELLHLVGRGRAMHVDTDSGLIWFTTVIGSPGAYQQLTFAADAVLGQELTIFEDDNYRQVAADGKTIVRAPKRFRLVIVGNLASDGNTYLKIQTCESPHGVGKDECGRDLKEN